MSITTIPVGLEHIFFISAAEDYQKSETGEHRASYDGTCYVLDISISAYVVERGLQSLASQGVSLEVPMAGADEALQALRGLPPQTPVRFESLTARSGVARSGSPYTIWTGRGLTPVRTAAPSNARRQAE